MARIAGVNIPQNKVVKTALTYIHGIGDKTANDICNNNSLHIVLIVLSTPLTIKK